MSMFNLINILQLKFVRACSKFFVVGAGQIMRLCSCEVCMIPATASLGDVICLEIKLRIIISLVIL